MRNVISLRQLAWILWGASMMLALITLILVIIGREAEYTGWGFRGFATILAIPFLILGLLILHRYPKHGLGWVFMGLGVLSVLQGLMVEYMLFSLILFPETLPGGLFFAWLLNGIWVLPIISISLLLVLFPDGNLPSTKWRIYVWVMIAGFIITALFNNFISSALNSSFAGLQNPYGFSRVDTMERWVQLFSVIIFSYAFIPPLINLIFRSLNAKGKQRQQYKWFSFGAAMFPLFLILSSLTFSAFLEIISVFAALLFAGTITIAILRHNLFDIDIIIQRTLIYSMVTIALVIVYFASVILLQRLFTSLTGQQSPLAIVLSTLLIAALFNPFRRRVQGFIDRRFYRRKYSAQQTLAQFAATARDEVDLERLTTELVQVVNETMQPESVSVWINPAGHSPPNR